MKTWPILLLLLIASGCNQAPTGSGPDTGDGLPPHPGAAGKATLEGIDSDNDGVRDDVQIAIYERYPNDVALQNALKQKAKAFQDALVAGAYGDTAAALQVSEASDKAMQCVYEKVGIENYLPESHFLKHEIINTSERSEAYINYNAALNGHVFTSKKIENPCE